MTWPTEPGEIHGEAQALFLGRLEMLYNDMDQQYQLAADYYGFHCRGCRDNCCRTRFYHHTVVEHLFLQKGFQALEKHERLAAIQQAKQHLVSPASAPDVKEAHRPFCPLNQDELCLLYAHRPMICRLHGLAHEVHMPGHGPSYGSGCRRFEEIAGDKSYRAFDRTPFYRRLAALEREVKAAVGAGQKFKMTIAQMVAGFQAD